MRAGTLPRPNLQDAILDGQVGIGRNDIDVVGLGELLARDLAHRESGGPRQDVGQRAFPRRVEMLHQNEGHAGVGRQVLKQLREGLEAAGRRADADDRMRRCYWIGGLRFRFTTGRAGGSRPPGFAETAHARRGSPACCHLVCPPHGCRASADAFAVSGEGARHMPAILAA